MELAPGVPREIVGAREAARGASPRLAALVFDVLSRQGEGQLLFAGKEFVDGRVAEHDVQETEAGGENVVELLRRGPSNRREYALLGALAVEGLRPHLGVAGKLTRFVRHADWLELSTPYSLYALVDPVLGEDAAPLWEAVAGAAAKEQGTGPRQTARRALHLAALAQSAHGRAAVLLGELAQGEDPETAKLAAALAGKAMPTGSTGQGIAGVVTTVPVGGWRGALRLVTGWAVAQWVGRGIMAALGWRRRVELRLAGQTLEVAEETQLFGRSVGKRSQSVALRAVASAGRSDRRPVAPFLVGAGALSLGVLTGALGVIEGLRSGETLLLGVGAALVAAGVAIDLAVHHFAQGLRGNVLVEVDLLPKRRLTLTGISEDAAESFVDALQTAIGK